MTREPSAPELLLPALDSKSRRSLTRKNTRPVPSYDPPNLGQRTLSAGQAQVQNLLCRRRYSIRFRIGDAGVHVTLGPGEPASSAYAWVEAELSGHPLRFGLPWTAARRITGVATEAATPEDAALLLEDGLTTVLDELERQSGQTITFQRVSPMREARSGDHAEIWLRIESVNRADKSPHRSQIPVELSAAAAGALAEALEQWKKPRTSDKSLYLSTRVELPAAVLTQAELASIRPGDAVVMDPVDRPARMIVENQMVAAAIATGKDGQWSLSTGFRPLSSAGIAFPFSLKPEKNMPDSESPQDQQTDPATSDAAGQTETASAASFDDVQVSLSVRFGEALVPLGELRNAGVGTIFTLDRPDGALVELVVNGTVVGSGELISVAGQRAVEVKTLFNEGRS